MRIVDISFSLKKTCTKELLAVTLYKMTKLNAKSEVRKNNSDVRDNVMLVTLSWTIIDSDTFEDVNDFFGCCHPTVMLLMVTHSSNWSSTSQTCHQLKLSPLSVSNIYVVWSFYSRMLKCLIWTVSKSLFEDTWRTLWFTLRFPRFIHFQIARLCRL